MLKRAAIAFLFSLLSVAGFAQAPSPGQLGLVRAVPNVVQVLDSTKTWSSIGTIDTTTHIFTPTGGGGGGGGITDAPNDGTLYGRKSLAWSHITHNDITDWAASVPPVYTLPVASTTVLGGVKVDGTTITATGGGVISAAAATPTAPGGTAGQVQYNNAGAFGGFTASGDATINTATGAVAVTKTGGTAFGALATITPGTGVATALGVATNANGGIALANTGLTNGNFTKWSATGLVDGGAGGTSIIFPQAVSGTVTSGGIPYFSSTTQMSSSGLLAANALVVGGGAGVTPATITTGTGVVTALGVNTGTAGAFVVNGGALGTPSSGTLTNATGLPIAGITGLGTGVGTALGTAVNTSGGIDTASASSIVLGSIETGGGSGAASVGLADVATGSYLKSGGVTTIPAWQAFGTGAQTAVNTAINTTGGLVTQSGTLAANALLLGGGSAAAITSTTTGTGVVTALGVNTGTAGAFVVNGGALGTPSSGTLTNATGLPISTGVSGLGTGVATALAANMNSASGLAAAAVPLTVGTSGSVSGADGYYVCTSTCTITLPTPAAGFQFCVRNDSAVVTVITIAAISSVQFEKTTYNGYGTVTTGTMVSGGALGDKICLVGRDATHYLVGSFVGTWTNS